MYLLWERKRGKRQGALAVSSRELLPSETVKQGLGLKVGGPWAGCGDGSGGCCVLAVASGHRGSGAATKPHSPISCLGSAGSLASPSTTRTSPTLAAGLARSCWEDHGASPSSGTSFPRSRITLPANSKPSVPRLSGKDAQLRCRGGRGTGTAAGLCRGTIPPQPCAAGRQPGPAGRAEEMSLTKEPGRVTFL